MHKLQTENPVTPETGPPIPGIIGRSPAMESVYRLTRRVARTNASVLLLGETGTGKELIATAIHRLSNRGSGRFVKVNCGALAENLLESELFGHVRGAFTGAIANRTGRFEAAHGGTIFLDEINSTSLHLQVKLLRVLQEREFERVGDTQTIQVDTRVIAASNRDLMDEVQAERFREDLYWRLNVVPILIPPLRERPEDIPELAYHFLQYYCKINGCDVNHIDDDAIEAMTSYTWPGNVRELQNYIERAIVMAEQGVLSVDLLPPTVRGIASPKTVNLQGADLNTLLCKVVQQGIVEAGQTTENLHSQIVDKVERELISQIMAECNNTQTAAASRLGINRNTLHKKLKEYRINSDG